MINVFSSKCGGCIFCEIPAERIILQNELAYAIRDGFPVTVGHSLIIPKRHVCDYFGLTQEELIACHELIHDLRREILQSNISVSGFNLGANAGAVAGQTVFHCHLHLIPRREHDVDDPRGGVRHIIPDKGFY